MLNNRIKEKLKRDEPVFGTFYKIYSPAMAEIMGRAGFDFIVIDTEHYFMTHEQMENVVRAADLHGMCTIIRVQDDTEASIIHALDTGASGVQIPSLSTAEEAREAVARAKYWPLGTRGWGPGTRAGDYGFTPGVKYAQYVNEHGLTVVHVENVEMLSHLDELCQIENLDTLFVGPGDLSQSMGKPGQLGDPEVVANVELVIRTARKYGKSVGTFVANEDTMKRYLDLGARYFTWGNDMGLYAAGIRNAVSIIDRYR